MSSCRGHRVSVKQWLTWLFTMPAESARSIKGDIFRSNALSPAPNGLLPQRSVSLRSPIDGAAPPSQKTCRLAKWDDGAVQFNLPGIPQGMTFKRRGGKSVAFPEDHWHNCLNLCRLLQDMQPTARPVLRVRLLGPISRTFCRQVELNVLTCRSPSPGPFAMIQCMLSQPQISLFRFSRVKRLVKVKPRIRDLEFPGTVSASWVRNEGPSLTPTICVSNRCSSKDCAGWTTATLAQCGWKKHCR